MTVRYTFKRSERISYTRDYRRVKQKGRYFFYNGLGLQILCEHINRPPRLGLVVSKKNFKKAVMRNRIKRILREIFRLNKHHIKSGCDIVAIPNAKKAGCAYHDMEKDFISLCKQAGVMR